MKVIRVLIADDHPLLRHGLRVVLSQQRDIDVVGQAENGAQALEIIDKTDPDVVILDIDMPVLDGVETARLMTGRQSRAKIIFLTIHKNRSLLRSLPRLGVSGYVLKDSAMEEIVECIRAVHSGNTYFSPLISEKPGERPADGGAFPAEAIEGLTEMEKAVLLEISRSRTNREIGDTLFISVRTVETHRYNICSKLGLKGPHSLLKFAVANADAIAGAIRLSSST